MLSFKAFINVLYARFLLPQYMLAYIGHHPCGNMITLMLRETLRGDVMYFLLINLATTGPLLHITLTVA